MERTFDTTTNDARFEIWTSDLKGLTGNISFCLQGLKITDETTGNDVSMTKIAMGNSDIKLTARWIPLHSTLSYDAQGGSLDSVKSTDNPNNYKIVDNGAYFIQSGLNTSRYLHQRTNGQLNLDNATDVLTWNGYSSDSKQTLWTFERYKNTPYYYIINNFNGKALDLSGDGADDLSGKPVELWKQCDANNENNSDFLWYFKDTGDGYVNIYNKMTNKVLDITNGEDADGVVLQHYAPNGTASQKFKLVNYSQVYFPTREKYANNNIYINSATPVKKGCKFLGWSTSKNGSVKYQPGDLYDVNQDGGNVTLYAQWEKAKYTATVKLNGGSYNGSTNDFTISKYPGETFSVGIPTKNKYNFSGWELKMDQDSNSSDFPKNVTYNVGYRLSTKKHKEQTGSYVNQPDMSNSFRWGNVENNKSVNLYNTVQYSKVHLKKGHHYKLIAQYYLNSNYNNNDAKFYVRIRSNDKQEVGESDYRISATYNKAGESIFDKTATADEDVTIEVDTVIPPGTKSSTLQYGMDIQLYDVTSQCYVGGDSSGEMNTGNFTLNAQWTPWKHTVTYNANAGNDASVKGIPASQSKTANVDITLSSDVPTRNGYTFLGWNTQADGNGTAYAAGATYTHDQDGGTVTLYAKWTPWKHVLHYNKNVPTSSTSQTVSNMPVDQTKTFGQLMTISNLVPTRKGYTFAGWYTQSNDTGTKYDPGSNYAADQNGGTVNLYAKWTPWTYNIKYDQNVKSTSSSKTVTDMPAAQTKTQEIDATLSSMTPKRNGYTFAGWSTSANGSVEYKPGSRFTKDLDSNGASITLYAVWTPWKYKVQYDKNVSADSSSQTVSNMPTDQTKTEEVVLTLSSNKPSRNGYIFNGWQAQINGKAVDYQPGAKLSYDVDDKDGSTIILKAQWTPWKHTVHYDKNVPANSSSQTVTNMPEDQTKTFDKKLNLSTKIPKREGYNFVGWLLEYGTAIAVVSPGTAYERDQNGGTYVLKAQWEPWKHTVHYDANGGDQSSVPNDQKKTYEQNMNVATKVPTRNEYKFLGWKAYHEYNDKSGNKHSELIGNYQPGASYNYDIDETGQYAADNGEYNKCGTVTMKAQWVQLYTVKYDGNQPAIKGVTVTGSVANQTQGQDESVNLQNNNFKNNSGIFKDWSVGQDAYKYAVKSDTFRKYIHPEGYGTKHSTMTQELKDYIKDANEVNRTLVRN